MKTTGMDLALEISRKAKRVILSHHLKDPIGTVFPENVVQVTDERQIKHTCKKSYFNFYLSRNQM